MFPVRHFIRYWCHAWSDHADLEADMKDFLRDSIIVWVSFFSGIYFVIWNSNCVRIACLYAIPEWLPRWW